MVTETRTATEENKGNDGNKNGGGGTKRKGINGSVPKEKEGDEFNNIKFKYMYLLMRVRAWLL